MTATPRPVMTPREFAQEWGLSINTVLARLAEGAIPGIKLGRRWFIVRAAVESWLAGAGQEAGHKPQRS